MPVEPLPPDPLQAVPDPRSIRARLGCLLRETDLLRRLLKLAITVESERRQEREEVPHGQ